MVDVGRIAQHECQSGGEAESIALREDPGGQDAGQFARRVIQRACRNGVYAGEQQGKVVGKVLDLRSGGLRTRPDGPEIVGQRTDEAGGRSPASG